MLLGAAGAQRFGGKAAANFMLTHSSLCAHAQLNAAPFARSIAAGRASLTACAASAIDSAELYMAGGDTTVARSDARSSAAGRVQQVSVHAAVAGFVPLGIGAAFSAGGL